MLAGEQYAIETFATTGSGTVREVGENTHFMAIPKMLHRSMPAKTMNEMMSHIRKQHGTLAFSQRNIYHGNLSCTEKILLTSFFCLYSSLNRANFNAMNRKGPVQARLRN